MKRESHLFACHKFLEEVGSQILTHLAKTDFRDLHRIEIICSKIEDYLSTLKNHAQWEEEFIFNKFFSKDEVFSFFGEHTDLEDRAKKIFKELKATVDLESQLRIQQGKLIYLNFRLFYASNLIHFHNEETIFLSLLQERATDDEIRAIDKAIYESLSSNDIKEMLERLFPPVNISEKKNILDDLKAFNPANFELAIPEIRHIFSEEEIKELIVLQGNIS